MHEKTRIAILGCGKMNRSHVKALVRQSERCRVTLAVDTNPERAQEVAELTGAKPARSLDGLWDQFDAIDICTPHHLHASQAIEAMSHGKHVLVEKPMATHESDAQEMIRVAERAQRVLMIGYVLRYHPLIQGMHKYLAAETFGRPISVTMATEDYYVPHSDWLRWVDTRGGGVLFSHGCHYIDLMIAWFGPIRRATCMRNRLVIKELEGEDTATALCEFDSGVIGTYTASQGAKYGRHGMHCSVICTEGRLDLDLPKGLLTVYDGEERVLLQDVPEKPIDAQIAHFLDCVENGETPITSGRSSILALRAIANMYQAELSDRIAVRPAETGSAVATRLE